MFLIRNGLYRFYLCGMIAATLTPGMRAQTSATFGEVIALGATPADVVLDESRQRLYLVNTANARVDVWDYAGKSIVGSINVGQSPLGAAMSMDNSTLYVANHDSSSLTVINLNGGKLGSVANTVALPAKPQGVEVGADGRAVICTDGSGTSSTANTLLIYDSTQATANQLIAVPFPPAPATPPALAPTTARITTQFNGKLLRTPDGLHIVGVSSITNNTSTVVYVYEPASGTILYSRTVTGQSSVLSMSPDGTRFMAGFTMYDRASLTVIAQQSVVTAPFTFPTGTSFSTTFNVGGSVFSPDGTTMYSAFNTAALTTPPPAPQAATLLISNPQNLAIKIGINLPESILAKMVVTQSGGDVWALSASGVTHLPLSTLYNYPILMPASTTVLLRQDDCNPGVAQGTLPINNIGGGTLTFAVPATISGGSAALAVTANSGVAPSTITFTMDPGRTAVIRTPGTNLYTGAATNTGAAVNIQLVSPNAINVPPTIRVYMNYRDSSMSGIIYPVPTAADSTATAYQGLNNLVLDETRHKVYISNPGYNRIEVFDTVQQQFVTPIPVGPLPQQMAMGLDGTTLYVANTGGESILMVDLDAQQVTGSVQFPPIPMAGNAAVIYPVGIAVTLSGLEVVMSNGNLWEVINGVAVPRTPTSVTGVATSGAQTPIPTPAYMAGSADGTKMILLGGTGTAYLYDGLTDTYTSSQKLFGSSTTTPGFGGAGGGAIIGYYGPLGVAQQGSFLLANGLVLNSALTAIGGAASPGAATLTPPAGPGQPPTQGVTSTGLRNVAAVAPVGTANFLRMSTPVRTSLNSATSDDTHTELEAVSVTTGQAALAVRMPENPVLSEFGTTRTAMPPQQMAVGSDGTVYTLTVSGLSVVPLTVTGPSTQPQIAASGGVMNADGTSTFAPGSFIVVNGTNLASTATASTLPPPTLLGGSCVLVDNVAIPLLIASPTQIGAQIPAGIRPGVNVVEVRSLATAQRSTPVVVTVQEP